MTQRFVDSAQDLSSSNTERDRLTVKVQGLERELTDTKLKLEKALAKASSASKKKKRVNAKVVMLQEKVARLEADLGGAEAKVAMLQERVTLLEVNLAEIEYKYVESALYGMWGQNPNFDFSSFSEHAIPRVAKWNARGRRP